MQVIRNFQNISKDLQNTVLTIGNFDGIHLGHQEILNFSNSIAKSQNLKSALLTFEPHPLKIIHQMNNSEKKFNQKILSLSQKLSFLKDNFLVDFTFVARFNLKLANLLAKNFVKEILVKQLKIKHLVIGYDFTFGKNRDGDADLLKELAINCNFFLHQIPAIISPTEQIYSSTQIRKSIISGNIRQANKILGRPYSLSGIVIRGKKIARNLGFPTANFLPKKDLLVPKFGVYQINALINNRKYQGILNFGIKPTFNQILNQPIFEAHIFDLDQEVYGQKLIVELIDFIREEKKFSSIEDLKSQILQDMSLCKKFFF